MLQIGIKSGDMLVLLRRSMQPKYWMASNAVAQQHG
jgi:hypothetical protein